VVNPYGTGLADDKRTYPYVEQLVRLHLGEEPLVRSVRSWDLGDPASGPRRSTGSTRWCSSRAAGRAGGASR
jgi:hypothetical protein